jgi:hypothetical protein
MASCNCTRLKDKEETEVFKSLSHEPGSKFSDDGTVTYFW